MENPGLTISLCEVLNAATLLPTPEVSLPFHSYLETLDHWKNPRDGVSEDPLTNPEEIWYTDGSSFVLYGKRELAVKVPGDDSWFSTHESSHGRKQKRTLNTPVSPWEISDTYSELQMSAILMNIPKFWFLGTRFPSISLKSQQSLVEIVLQNRQEINLLISEQGGTWVILAMGI